MGVRYGRTKKANFYSYAMPFFIRKIVGEEFTGIDFVGDFLTTRSYYEPDFDRGADSRNTSAVDSLRTFVSIGICKRVRKGVYKLLCVPETKHVGKFNREYPNMKDPNRKKNKERRLLTEFDLLDDVEGLTKLGSQKTEYKLDSPSVDILETFDNKYPDRDYRVQLVFPEWTSLCPRTKQPDFATIIVDYIPNRKCVESKSLKLYFFAYRNYGAFMESITNRVLEDLVSVCSPRWMKVTGKFNARGGTFINVEAEYYSNKASK